MYLQQRRSALVKKVKQETEPENGAELKRPTLAQEALSAAATAINDSFETLLGILTSPLTIKIVTRSVASGGLALFAACTALLCYANFYWSYIPALSLSQKVYLQYSFAKQPHALVDLQPSGRYLSPDQAYDATLELHVPTSTHNYNLGNFMVHFEVRAKDNATMWSASRPSCLAYESPVIRTLHSLMNPRVILGINRAQSQHLSIPLAEKVVFQKESSTQASHALIEIGRRDFAPIHALEPVELHVYDATLRFDACFSGLRFLMYHYRLTTFVVFTTAFFLVQVFSALLIWSFLVYARTQAEPDAPARTDAKPSQADLLRAADHAEAEEAKVRQREAALQEQRRMVINPSRHTVLAALREKDRESDLDQATEDEDQASQRSSRSWEVAEPIKEEEEEIATDDKDEKVSTISGGSSTSKGTSDTFGTFRSNATPLSAGSSAAGRL